MYTTNISSRRYNGHCSVILKSTSFGKWEILMRENNSVTAFILNTYCSGLNPFRYDVNNYKVPVVSITYWYLQAIPIR